MRRKRKWLAVALVAAAVLGALAFAAWRDPYVLIRAEFARERWQAGLSAGEIEVAGHRWAYAYSNDAPPGAPTLLMVHGFTGSKENWYPLAQRLRGRYRLLIPDLPGWGESERRAGEDYGFVAQARRVEDFIHALSPHAPVALLGHSMGGGIAALLAARDSADVARLGLFDAAGVRFGDNRFGEDVLAGGNPFAVSDATTLQRYLDTVFHSRKAQPWIPWPASAALIERRRHDAAFEQRVLDSIGRGDERFLPGEEAARIRQPTLLLWCKQDAVIDASALDLYAARIPQARKVLLDDCGHMSIMERPDAVADAVNALIEQDSPR